MKKVIILEKGLIARESDNCPIGRIIREADIPEKIHRHSGNWK